MSGRVAIIGVGMEKVGVATMPSWNLFAHAALSAMNDAGIERSQIQALHIGNVYSSFTERQTNIAPLALSTIGINTNIPSMRYETACASGSVAFRQGYLGILSGMYDIVLVGGTERLRAISGTAIQEAMATSMDVAERSAGLIFAVYWSYVAKAYGRKYQIDDASLQRLLANISIKNHYHGSFNKKAQFQKEISLEDVMNSSMVAPPIKVMDCCPFSDGAAALVLASDSIAKECKKPIWIAGSGQASGSWSVADSTDLATNPAITKAAQEAYRLARVGPKDIDVVEVHDCVNIHEVLCLECTGLLKPGEGIYSAEERRTYFNGDVPTNLSGGLKARGHPVGATGAYQLCEITQQLRGEFDGKEVEDPEIGMTVNVGGTGTVVTVNILRREG
ncbi:MAG: thiolase C-terminal domain-containing protein [Desulfomonilaceae bacterium]